MGGGGKSCKTNHMFAVVCRSSTFSNHFKRFTIPDGEDKCELPEVLDGRALRFNGDQTWRTFHVMAELKVGTNVLLDIWAIGPSFRSAGTGLSMYVRRNMCLPREY